MSEAEDIFYVIFMPNTLHFLIPCLRLIHNKAKICLVVNGAATWEQNFIKTLFPELPQQRLAVLPRSSASHGDVLNLLLATSTTNFGVIDHDAYVFNERVFDDLSFNDDEFLIAYFYDFGEKSEVYYPLTYFLFFNTRIVTDIVRRNNIDCRLYKRPPANILNKLVNSGIAASSSLKDHHSFFDTMHLLYAVACAEGLRVGILDVDDEYAILHVGSTSGSSHLTKELIQDYIDLRFLELPCNRELVGAYKNKMPKLGSSDDLRLSLARNKDTFDLLLHVDTIISRLEKHSAITA